MTFFSLVFFLFDRGREKEIELVRGVCLCVRAGVIGFRFRDWCWGEEYGDGV